MAFLKSDLFKNACKAFLSERKLCKMQLVSFLLAPCVYFQDNPTWTSDLRYEKVGTLTYP